MARCPMRCLEDVVLSWVHFILRNYSVFQILQLHGGASPITAIAPFHVRHLCTGLCLCLKCPFLYYNRRVQGTFSPDHMHKLCNNGVPNGAQHSSRLEMRCSNRPQCPYEGVYRTMCDILMDVCVSRRSNKKYRKIVSREAGSILTKNYRIYYH